MIFRAESKEKEKVSLGSRGPRKVVIKKTVGPQEPTILVVSCNLFLWQEIQNVEGQSPACSVEETALPKSFILPSMQIMHGEHNGVTTSMMGDSSNTHCKEDELIFNQEPDPDPDPDLDLDESSGYRGDQDAILVEDIHNNTVDLYVDPNLSNEGMEIKDGLFTSFYNFSSDLCINVYFSLEL